MTVIPLLRPRVHALKKRRRDLLALQRRVGEELAIIDGQIRACTAALPIHCGTERGYQWHRHQDHANWPLPADDPCGCRAAHRKHERERIRRSA